jgi:hypothetical protein
MRLLVPYLLSSPSSYATSSSSLRPAGDPASSEYNRRVLLKLLLCIIMYHDMCAAM